MFVNRCYDNKEMIDNKQVNSMGMGTEMNMGMDMNTCCPSCPPVTECPQERVCHRNICYDVPHIIPINTRIINHHIYRHTYQPVYTCTMEDEISNVYDNKCGF